jgi:hypothetical protein
MNKFNFFSNSKMTSRLYNLILYVVAFLSIGLIAISVWGVFVDPYRDYKANNNLQEESVFYEVLDASFLRNGQSEEFLTDLINNFAITVKYEWADDIDLMPIEENWILHFFRIFDPLVSKYLLHNSETRLFGKVELPSYKYAIHRGLGICSQLSLSVADLLYKRYGMNAKVAGLNGHVVVQVYGVSGRDYVVDPSAQKFFEGNVMHPLELDDSHHVYKTSKFYELYISSGDNYVTKGFGWDSYSKSSPKLNKYLMIFVFISYYLKWILPLITLMSSIFLLKKTTRFSSAN